MFAKVDEGVDPRKQLNLIILYATFYLAGFFGFLVLFVAGLFSRRLLQNKVLLSFFAVFTIATAANTILIWTGNVMKDIPFALCVVSGAFGSSITVLQTGAAIALVMKIWAHALLINQPRSVLLRAISSSYILVILPWLAATPFFISAIIIGSKDWDNVTRASPFYCTFHLHSLNTAMQVTDAIFELSAIILAGWTASLVARIRWRARAVRSSSSGNGSYYSLTIRTLIFNVLLLVAFSSNVATALTSFSAPIPDVINALVTMLAVPVFGSDPTIIRILRCQPDEDVMVITHPTVSITLTHQTHIQRDDYSGPDPQNAQELSNIRCPPGLGSESKWKGVVVDDIALEVGKDREYGSEEEMSREGKRSV